MNEKMETEKRQWQKPELMVLVRKKSEEAVLLQCKGIGAGPQIDVASCVGGAVACIACDSLAAS